MIPDNRSIEAEHGRYIATSTIEKSDDFDSNQKPSSCLWQQYYNHFNQHHTTKAKIQTSQATKHYGRESAWIDSSSPHQLRRMKITRFEKT